MRAFGDFRVGDRFETASRTVTRDEIIAFASQWDRQPFHLDEAAARETIYGGLIASGWHTLLIAFDLVVEAGIWTAASQGSPGMEQVRWIAPVRPDDTLSVTFEVVETRPSRTRTDRGYVVWDHTVRNQSGETVATFRSTSILLTDLPEG